MVTLCFYSARRPPLEFYGAMEAQGFGVEAYYYEPGSRYCGMFKKGTDDRFEIKGDSVWARKHLPAVLNDMMGIDAAMEVEDQ